MAKKVNKDELVQCCYNKSHIVLKQRIQIHLCKCRKQYPTKLISICPFNATHSVFKPEIQFHIENCPDREKADSHVCTRKNESLTKPEEVELPNPNENWDEEPESQSYLETKDNIISTLPILRTPMGQSRSKRKEFLHDEVKKFQDFSNKKTNNSKTNSIK